MESTFLYSQKSSQHHSIGKRAIVLGQRGRYWEKAHRILRWRSPPVQEKYCLLSQLVNNFRRYCYLAVSQLFQRIIGLETRKNVDMVWIRTSVCGGPSVLVHMQWVDTEWLCKLIQFNRQMSWTMSLHSCCIIRSSNCSRSLLLDRPGHVNHFNVSLEARVGKLYT